jgi:hypothetical protein
MSHLHYSSHRESPVPRAAHTLLRLRAVRYIYRARTNRWESTAALFRRVRPTRIRQAQPLGPASRRRILRELPGNRNEELVHVRRSLGTGLHEHDAL